MDWLPEEARQWFERAQHADQCWVYCEALPATPLNSVDAQIVRDTADRSITLVQQCSGAGAYQGVWRVEASQIDTLANIKARGQRISFTVYASAVAQANGPQMIISIDLHRALSALQQVSSKTYTLHDFPYAREFSDETAGFIQALLSQSDPPCHIDQAITNLFRQRALVDMGHDMAFERYVKQLEATTTARRMVLQTAAGAVNSVLYRAERPTGNVLLYLHGGGWLMLDANAYSTQSRRICADSGWNILAIDYPLAPEQPFPAAFACCLDVFKHLVDCKLDHQLGFKIEHVALAGDSAGGALAAGIVNARLDREAYAGRGLVLLSPVTNMVFEDCPSFNERASHDPFITAGLAAFQRAVYLPFQYWRHPYYSPYFGDLNNYPDTLVITGAVDPLLEDNQRFVARLSEHGNRVEHIVAPGFTHDYQFCLPLTAAANRAYTAITNFLNQF